MLSDLQSQSCGAIEYSVADEIEISTQTDRNISDENNTASDFTKIMTIMRPTLENQTTNETALSVRRNQHGTERFTTLPDRPNQDLDRLGALT